MTVGGSVGTSTASTAILDYSTGARVIARGTGVGNYGVVKIAGTDSAGSAAITGGIVATFDSSNGAATFAGAVTVSASFAELAIRSTSDAAAQRQYLTFGSPTYNRAQFQSVSAGTNDGSLELRTFNAGTQTLSQTWNKDGSSTFAGAVAIGNTVAVGVAVASTHKVTMVIGGVTYYLLASNV
jgi:hypothetical protein